MKVLLISGEFILLSCYKYQTTSRKWVARLSTDGTIPGRLIVY